MHDILVSGLLLSGTYALIALGLNLQYGVARIMNLASGEVLVLGALAAFWLFTTSQISPLLTVLLIAPIAFAGNWLIYRFLLAPLVRRSGSQGPLEVASILATFGMSFFLIGVMISIEGGFFAPLDYEDDLEPVALETVPPVLKSEMLAQTRALLK